MKSGYYWLLKLNPLYSIITIFRASIFGEMMNIHYFLYAFGFSVVTIVIGLLMFIKKQDEFILNI
jgi:ABC-2 type transport system permease protein